MSAHRALLNRPIQVLLDTISGPEQHTTPEVHISIYLYKSNYLESRIPFVAITVYNIWKY